MATAPNPGPKLPPSWFIHAFWRVHRVLHRVSGGRFLWTPASKRGWGAMGLTTTGRRTGRPRTVVVGYIEDDGKPVVMAMNGWQEGHPAWWSNLVADPEVTITLPGERARPARARTVTGDERARLWQRWSEIDHDLDGYASRRHVDTPVVVFEPC